MIKFSYFVMGLIAPVILVSCASPSSPVTGGAPVVDRSVSTAPPPPPPAAAEVPEMSPPVASVQVQPLPPIEPIPPVAQQGTPKPPPKPKKAAAPASPPKEKAPAAAEAPEDQAAATEEPIPEPEAPAAEPPPPPDPVIPPAQISEEGDPAVTTLLASAGDYVGSGELDKAAAALERALRIEPRNAGIWHDLGQVRLHQNQYGQAESLFSKSNSLAGENQGLKSNNWELISVARRAQGDLEGAEAAEAQAVVSQGGEEDQAASENNE